MIYHLDHNIPIIHNTITFPYLTKEGKSHKYLPDFRVNGILHEIKGWDSNTHQIKIAAVTEPIVVVLGRDNDIYIDYTMNKSKLSYKRLVELYDISPHLHQFICECCRKEVFLANKEARLCSQSCSGKMAAIRRKNKRMAEMTGLEPAAFPLTGERS